MVGKERINFKYLPIFICKRLILRFGIKYVSFSLLSGNNHHAKNKSILIAQEPFLSPKKHKENERLLRECGKLEKKILKNQ